MTTNKEQQIIASGLHIGNNANHQIADAIVNKATKMLEDALSSNFETILEAKLSVAVQETINIHTENSKRYAQQFLGQTKSRLAHNLIDTQHSHRMTEIQSNLSLDDLNAFDTDLTLEVARLADEAGSITININESSSIGF